MRQGEARRGDGGSKDGDGDDGGGEGDGGEGGGVGDVGGGEGGGEWGGEEAGMRETTAGDRRRETRSATIESRYTYGFD